MYLRAGVISLALLLASRVLGLLRESVQAATFGTTGLADLVVMMLTLPDLASAILAAGALSYALLPLWGGLAPAPLAQSQRRVGWLLAATGAALAAALWLMSAQVGRLLVPGATDVGVLVRAVHWAAPALPLALLGSLWYTRLQHERDAVGMYGMNIVHTGAVVLAMLALGHATAWPRAIDWMGAGLLLALALRLAFLAWRLQRLAPAVPAVAALAAPRAPLVPGWRIWLWATVAAGAPTALVLLARSLVSQQGEGALAMFSYAWKLVELPNLLAIQLVATLAFPALTRARAEGRDFSVQLRAAFLLSWTLACAAAVGLWTGAGPLARLLFGWGRMGPEHVAQVAQWAAWGAWTLLPQALIAVAVLVLATIGRLQVAAGAFAAAVAALLALGGAGLQEGQQVMMALAGLMAALAAVLLRSLGPRALQSLPWREMAIPGALCVGLALAASLLPASQPVLVLALAGLFAALVVGAGWATSPALRAALKR
jgi:peptidoglycan biosynthesis protein MviN/MurJ (putative lipid II flippase)